MVDWSKIIQEILDSQGWGIVELAERMAVPHTTLRRLHRQRPDTEPRHELGDFLVSVHSTLVKHKFDIHYAFPNSNQNRPGHGRTAA